MTPALIVVDMIKDNIETEKHLGISQEAKSILPNLGCFINYFRENGFPVVYANDSFLKDVVCFPDSNRCTVKRFLYDYCGRSIGMS